MGTRTLYNEEGDEVIVPDDEEITSLKTKAETAEAEKTNLQKTLEEKGKEYASYKSANQSQFTNLKGKSKEEIAKYRQEVDEKNRPLFDEIVSLREERETEKAEKRVNWDEKILRQMAGDDKDLRTKLQDIEKSYNGEAKTYDQQQARYERAYKEAVGHAPDLSPLNAYHPSTSTPGVGGGQGRSFTSTPKGKAIAEEFFGKVGK